MTDLSHWDYETDFTAEQVAALIIGVDPGEAQTERARMAPVLRRLEKAYRAALDKCYSRYIPFLLPSERPAYAGEELSGQLIAELEKLGPHTPDTDVILDRVDAARDGFLDDTFPRPNVASWLTATGLKSVYSFETQALLAGGRAPEAGSELKTTERNSLLKIVWGMATGGYKFDPEAGRSEVPKEIAGDCAAAGVPIDPDTVRKYLREASQQVDRSIR